MNNTLKFGLSDSLINTVREVVEGKVCPTCGKSPCQCDGDVKKVEEALKSGQKKLDKNHNGKLDKQDFKMLRGKKMEEELDELAPATMKSYQSKAVDSIGHAAQSARSMGSDKDHLKKPLGNEIRKRKKGLDLANERLAKKDMDEETDPGFSEAEQLDELSPKTLYSYGSKAHNQVIKTGMGLTKKQGGLRTKGVSLEDGKRKMANRKAGVELAHKKAQAKTNEEIEQVDEVLDTPMKKLGYIAKNAYQVATADPAKMANDPKKANAIANRVIGAKRLIKKLNKEEVDFSEAEIARINEILKDL